MRVCVEGLFSMHDQHKYAGKKHEGLSPSTHNVDQPIVDTHKYGLIDFDGDHLSLMDESGNPKEDVKTPGDDYSPDPTLGERIVAAFDDLDDGLFISRDCSHHR